MAKKKIINDNKVECEKVIELEIIKFDDLGVIQKVEARVEKDNIIQFESLTLEQPTVIDCEKEKPLLID